MKAFRDRFADISLDGIAATLSCAGAQPHKLLYRHRGKLQLTPFRLPLPLAAELALVITFAPKIGEAFLDMCLLGTMGEIDAGLDSAFLEGFHGAHAELDRMLVWAGHVAVPPSRMRWISARISA